MKYIAAFLVALSGCGGGVGFLALWLLAPGPSQYTGWVTLGSFVLAVFSVLMGALISGVEIE